MALAACRAGDTLVVTKLDRLARSLPDARDILDELTNRDGKLGSAARFTTRRPGGRLLFNVLAMVAEFEADLIRLRTREGMKIAKAKGTAARQAAEAEAESGQAPARAAQPRHLQPSRTGRAVWRRTVHDLPHPRSDAACSA